MCDEYINFKDAYFNPQTLIITEQRRLIYQFLSHLHAAQYLHRIFIAVPERFVERMVKHLYIEELRKDRELGHTYRAIDKKTLVAVFYDMERMARNFTRVEQISGDRVVSKFSLHAFRFRKTFRRLSTMATETSLGSSRSVIATMRGG